MELSKYLLNIKQKYESMMMGTNCIAKLMKDHIDDHIIIKEQPQAININGQPIYVGNFTLENERNFFHGWAKIIGLLCARITNMEITQERKKELLERADFHMLSNGSWLMEFLLMDNWLEKQLIKLLKNTLIKQQAYILIGQNRVNKKWKNKTYGWFKKNIDKETLIQICWLIYTYNFDAVKKNLKILVEKMDIKQQTETYMYFWLQNCPGLNGKFLLAQAPNIDYAFRDKPNDMKKQKVEINDIFKNKKNVKGKQDSI